MGQRPYLKYNVDLQLQTAWQEGNWAVTARLADKRAKALKDPYYEVSRPVSPTHTTDGTRWSKHVLKVKLMIHQPPLQPPL